MIIAIDGPAAAGKGTLARRLAAHFGLRYLDTGSIYRAVGWAVMISGNDPADPVAAEAAARSLDPDLLSDPELRSEPAAAAASKVAAIPGLRAALLEFQRDFARKPPGAVLDGRDIGTVVCPDAEVKLFVTASPAIRAERRWKELREQGVSAIREGVLAAMEERDRRDAERGVAPLRPAPDAEVLDTSDLDADTAFAAALGIVARRRATGS